MKKKIFCCVGVWIAIILSTALSAQTPPDWLSRIQLFQMSRGYVINPSPILSVVRFTGQGWGVYFPNALDDRSLTLEFDAWHSRDAVYVAFGATKNLYVDYPVPVPDSHRVLDLYGNFVPGLENSRQYSLCSEAWQAFVKSENRRAIDLGADGIHFDDAVVFPYMLCSWNAQPAPFDSVTMAAFRAHLDAAYSDAELSLKFDITDITSFDYAGWIRTHGMESTWNAEPFTGLCAEFFLFLNQATRNYFHAVAEDARSYAMNTYGRALTISCNPMLTAEGYFAASEVDYFQAEHFTFDTMDPFAHVNVKAVRGMKSWPVFVVPEPKKTGLPQSTWNMIRLVAADIYASGGRVSFAEKLSEGIPHVTSPITIDFEVFSGYANFILSNPALYENLTPVSNVALLNSHISRMARYWPIEGNARCDFGAAFVGAGKLLVDSNIQFDCVFAPDARFTSIPSFTLSQLQRYQAVVLPNTFELTDEQAQLILEYMQGGGTVIAMGSIGTNNPDGTLADRPALLSLQQADGVKSYGAGWFVYNSMSLGEAYLADLGIPHDHVRNQFQGMILPYSTPLVVTEGVSEIYRPGGASGFLYEDGFGNTILHLVNYDFDEMGDRFSAKQNFTLKVRADTSMQWQAVYASPDFPGTQVLAVTHDEGYLCLTIPELDAYGIVVLQQNTAAPMITHQFPQADTTLIGGNSLHLSIEASDADGNPLFCRWFVNGAVDSAGLGSRYLYRTEKSDSGVDTVIVQVSDGTHLASAEWHITVQPYVYPRILFDEAHSERNTISFDRAQILNPEHPDWVHFGILKDEMERDFVVDRLESGTLSESLLADYEVLFLPVPESAFSASETEAVVNFIHGGGGLLFLGDAGSDESINALLELFGIHFDLIAICSPAEPGWEPRTFDVNDFTAHPSLMRLPQYGYSWGGSLELTAPAQSLGRTKDSAWRDTNWDGIKDAGETAGPFTVIAASEYGEGRVFSLSDNSFNDEMLAWEQNPNDDLLLFALKWLTEGVNTVGVEVPEIPVSPSFDLMQNYPNPFNPATKIQYEVPRPCTVEMHILNIMGQTVRILVEGERQAGRYAVEWDGRDSTGMTASSGLYFCSMKAGSFVKTIKLMVLH